MALGLVKRAAAGRQIASPHKFKHFRWRWVSMQREVPTWLVVVIIVIVLAIVGFAYWHFGRPKAVQEEKPLPAAHQPALP
jgi:hypothetical protein